MFNENMLNEYSLEEKVVGKWVDDKPLYRKVIPITDFTYNKYLLLDTPSNIRIKRYEGYIVRGNEESVDGFSKGVVLQDDTLLASIRQNKIEYRIIPAFNNITDGYFIIEYTKTTD